MRSINNIQVIQVLEIEKEEDGAEKALEEIMTESSPVWQKA